MKPLLYDYLVTSTPDSHRTTKRIKGMLGFSEHYKGNRVDYPHAGPSFSPLQARDYRRAREITLEIWDPMVQASFLKKFLKSQRNLQTIRIRVLTQENYNRGILKRVCEILCKMSRLSRVYVDFENGQKGQVYPGLFKRVRPMRMLPKLKALEVTVNGELVYPFSACLAKVGFDGEDRFVVKKASVIQKLIKRTPKFDQLDTIKLDCLRYGGFPEEMWDGLLLVLSKLPNFRELDLNYPREHGLPCKRTLGVLDILMKAPRFEIFRIGVQIKEPSQISMLEHPLFRSKSLKRTHVAIYLICLETSTQNLAQIWDLLRSTPSLYELSLTLMEYRSNIDAIAEGLIRQISEIASLRKLSIIFGYSYVKVEGKQYEKMVRSIFQMKYLEELMLRLPIECLDLGSHNGRDIEGLPRLTKASIQMTRWGAEREGDIRGMIGVLGKCCQLRELEVHVSNSVYDYPAMILKLCESLRELKRLQVLKLSVSNNFRTTNMTITLLEDLVMVLNGMRSLQDVYLFTSLSYSQEIQRFREQLKMNKKYRCINIVS